MFLHVKISTGFGGTAKNNKQVFKNIRLPKLCKKLQKKIGAEVF